MLWGWGSFIIVTLNAWQWYHSFPPFFSPTFTLAWFLSSWYFWRVFTSHLSWLPVMVCSSFIHSYMVKPWQKHEPKIVKSEGICWHLEVFSSGFRHRMLHALNDRAALASNTYLESRGLKSSHRTSAFSGGRSWILLRTVQRNKVTPFSAAFYCKPSAAWRHTPGGGSLTSWAHNELVWIIMGVIQPERGLVFDRRMVSSRRTLPLARQHHKDKRTCRV